MSIQSAEDFDPTSSTPVFGSAVSQAKLQQQQQPTNDVGGSEKLVTPPQPIPNGQSEPANEKNGENLGNGTASSHHTNGGDAPENHVNGKHETSKDYDKPAEEAIPTSAVSDPVEKSSQNESSSTPSTEPVADLSSSAPAEPEPALTTSAETAKEDAPAATTADVAVAEPAAMETDVPAPKVAVPATPEPKTKSPRGKPKTPVVATLPTRQSARSRKPVSSLTADDDEKIDDDIASASPNKSVESSPANKRGKRQAATPAKEAVTPAKQATPAKETATPVKEAATPTKEAVPASNPPDSTTGSKSVVEEVKESIPAKAAEPVEDKSETKSPSPRKGGRASANASRKRGASSSPSVAAAKKSKASPKGKKSITPTDDAVMDVEPAEPATATPAATSETAPVQTPPKKARSSATRKTPTSASTTPESSGDYVRKLRPRK